MLLRHGRVYLKQKTWTAVHRRWISAQRFPETPSDAVFDGITSRKNAIALTLSELATDGWGLSYRATNEAGVVVVLAPALDHDLCLGEAGEQLNAEQLRHGCGSGRTRRRRFARVSPARCSCCRGTPGAPRARDGPGASGPRLCGATGSEVSFAISRIATFSNSLSATVCFSVVFLPIEFLQALRVVDLHPAVLRTSPVMRRL